MDRENNTHESGADRTGADRFKGDDNEANDVQEANENIRKAQGDGSIDATGTSARGNRPRIDRDR